MGRALLVVLAVLSAGCPSPKNFLAEQAAVYLYHDARYQAGCPAALTPEQEARKLLDVAPIQSCPKLRADLLAANRRLKVSDDILQKTGTLPREARRDLNAATGRIRADQ